MCLSQTVLNWELIMSVRPLGAATCSWLSAACPATRTHRYTTTSRQFKVGRELSGLRKAVTLQLPLLEVALSLSFSCFLWLLFPSFCDVFIWLLSSFLTVLTMHDTASTWLEWQASGAASTDESLWAVLKYHKVSVQLNPKGKNPLTQFTWIAFLRIFKDWYWSMYEARESLQFWYDLCHIDSELFHHCCFFWSTHPLEELTIKDIRLEIQSHELSF